jgi:hypothetical protein
MLMGVNVFEFLPKSLRAPATLIPVCVSMVAGGWYAGNKLQAVESRLTRIEERLDIAKSCESQISDVRTRLAVLESKVR